MGKEIERRWVIPKSKISNDFFNSEDYLLTTFFNSDIGFFRLREKHTPNKSTYKICIKKGKGISRVEIETELAEDEFKELSKDLKFIKTFYKVVPIKIINNKGTDEIYHLEYKDLGEDVILEVEFSSEEVAKSFSLGRAIANDADYKEVTDDKNYNFYSYYNRALNG